MNAIVSKGLALRYMGAFVLMLELGRRYLTPHGDNGYDSLKAANALSSK